MSPSTGQSRPGTRRARRARAACTAPAPQPSSAQTGATAEPRRGPTYTAAPGRPRCRTTRGRATGRRRRRRSARAGPDLERRGVAGPLAAPAREADHLARVVDREGDPGVRVDEAPGIGRKAGPRRVSGRSGLPPRRRTPGRPRRSRRASPGGCARLRGTDPASAAAGPRPCRRTRSARSRTCGDPGRGANIVDTASPRSRSPSSRATRNSSSSSFLPRRSAVTTTPAIPPVGTATPPNHEWYSRVATRATRWSSSNVPNAW